MAAAKWSNCACCNAANDIDGRLVGCIAAGANDLKVKIIENAYFDRLNAA